MTRAWKDFVMPFPQPKQQRPVPPPCPACRRPMTVQRRTPLSYAPTFEAIEYRCEDCRTLARHNAVPILDDDRQA
jgi:hypothetical protein